MTIINISRQPYSSGNEIADKIAEKLNFKLIDKQLINNKIKDFHCNFSDELNDLANEKEPGFFKHFFKDPEVYTYLLKAILFEEASDDNVLIKGRGGQYVLTGQHVLNIRIIAPFEIRCAALQQQKGLNQSAAEVLLEKLDHGRENFIQYLFHQDASEAETYDVIFNSGNLSPEIIVSTILNYAKESAAKNPMSEDTKTAYKCQALEKRVEATLQKKYPEIVKAKATCDTLGEIKISGFVPDEIESNKIYNLAKKCNGVTSVENNLDTIRMHKT